MVGSAGSLLHKGGDSLPGVTDTGVTTRESLPRESPESLLLEPTTKLPGSEGWLSSDLVEQGDLLAAIEFDFTPANHPSRKASATFSEALACDIFSLLSSEGASTLGMPFGSWLLLILRGVGGTTGG